MGRKKNYATKASRKGLTPNPEAARNVSKWNGKTTVILKGIPSEPGDIQMTVASVRTSKKDVLFKCLYSCNEHDLAIDDIIAGCKLDPANVEFISLLITKTVGSKSLTTPKPIVKWSVSLDKRDYEIFGKPKPSDHFPVK